MLIKAVFVLITGGFLKNLAGIAVLKGFVSMAERPKELHAQIGSILKLGALIRQLLRYSNFYWARSNIAFSPNVLMFVSVTNTMTKRSSVLKF